MKRSHKSHRRFSNAFRLVRLEDRITPALVSIFDDVSGALTVTSDAADSIQIGASEVHALTINGTNFVNSTGTTILARQVHSITVIGGPGNNEIDLSGIEPVAFSGLQVSSSVLKEAKHTPNQPAYSNFTCVVDGRGGADTIKGSQVGDFIECSSGADTVTTGRGSNMILIRNSDISSLTINGDPFGHNAMMLDYTPFVGAKMFATYDVATQISTIEYAGKYIITKATHEIATGANNSGNKIGEIGFTLTDSSGPGGGGGGTVDIASRQIVGVTVEVMEIAPIATAGPDRRLKWTQVSCKRGITSSMDAWKWRADPSSEPISIECTGVGNTLVVNDFGYASFTSAQGVSVSGFEPITTTNMVASTETLLYDAVALADLAAAGVQISTDVVDHPDGTQSLSITVANNGTTPVSGGQITFGRAVGKHKGDYLPAHNFKLEIDGIIGTNPGPGVTVSVDDGSARTAAELAMGQSSDHTITFALPNVGPGQTSTSSATMGSKAKAWMVNNRGISVEFQASAGGKKHRVVLDSFFSPGATPSSPQFAALIDSALHLPDDGSTAVAITASGNYALCYSVNSGIDWQVQTFTAGKHLYLGNRMVDIAFNGTASGNGVTGKAEMSADGRYVVFESTSTNLVDGLSDTNGATDIFVRDMLLGKTYCLSSKSDVGGQTTGNGASFDPQMAVDGGCVTFLSSATNLVPGVTDLNNAPDLHVVQTASAIKVEYEDLTMKVASLVPNTMETCDDGVVSADVNGDLVNGYTFAYLTDATNTGSPGTTGMQLGVAKDGFPIKWKPVQGWIAGKTGGLSISLDGGTVALWTNADISSLAGVPDTNNVMDILSINATTGGVTPVSTNFDHTAMADGPSPAHPGESVSLSIDGRTMAFTSTASNLIPGLVSPATDGVYRYVLNAGVPVRFDSVGSNYGADNHVPSISGDGDTIVWASSTDYHPTDGTKKIRDWVKTSYDKRIINASGGSGVSTEGPNQDALNPVISSNGQRIIFTSAASNLVPGDTNGDPDAFSSALHDSFVFTLPGTMTPAVTLEYDAITLRVRVRDANGVVTFREVPAAFDGTIYVDGRDGVNDVITVDALSLQPLGGNVVIRGVTASDTLDVTFGTGLGRTDVTDVEIRSGYTRIQGREIVATATLSDGTTRDVTRRLYSMDCVGPAAINDRTEAPQINVDSNQLTHNVTKIGDDLVITSGDQTIVKGGYYSVILGGGVALTLSPGNDTVTVDVGTTVADAVHSLAIFGNGGKDTMNSVIYTAPTSGFLLSSDGIPASTGQMITGGAGNDTIVIGGGGTFNGGPGHDEFHFTNTAGTSNVVVLGDADGDRVNFSQFGYSVALDMDLQTTQPFSEGTNGPRQVTVTGVLEDALFGPFDDTITVKARSTPRSVDGGDEIMGDMLTVNAEGKAATIFEGQVHVKGMAPITYTDIEHVMVVNNAPTLQVAVVEINDDEIQRSKVMKIVVGFNGPVTFPNGVASAIQLTDNNTGFLTAYALTPLDGDGFTSVVITFPAGTPDYGSLANGAFTLKVVADQIASPLGPLDGNGDGFVLLPSEDYVSPPTLIFRTFGDFNGDRTSNLIDFAQFRDAFNVGPSDIFDAEGDGAVGLIDFALFRLRFNILV